MTAEKKSQIIVDDIHTAEHVCAATAPRGTALLLHGWGASGELMLPLGEALARAGYSAYLPDLPGFGSTGTPPQAWGVPDYARFVLAYLDVHGLERVHLIGHSFGGRVALILAAEHPDRFDKLVLIDSAGVPFRSSPLVRGRTRLYKGVRAALDGLGARTLSAKLSDWYSGRYGSPDYQAASGVMRPTFVKVVNHDLRPYAARISAPTLLFWGDQDADTPLWMGQELERLIPDAALIIFKGAGHYSYLERTGDVVRILTQFYSG